MKTSFTFPVVAAMLIAAMGMAACSDDNNPTDTGTDTSPPAISSVTAEDSLHLTVAFNEPVDRTAAEEEANYAVVRTGATTDTLVVDSLAVVAASLMQDNRTVVLTTSGSMTNTAYRLTVDDIEDTKGNAVTTPINRSFTGSNAPDQTAPVIVMSTPRENQTNVGLTAPIEVQFSEPVQPGMLLTGVALSSGGVPVTVDVTSTDNLHFTITPTAPLEASTVYTLSLSGVSDTANNVMADQEWTFQTGTGTTVTSVGH